MDRKKRVELIDAIRTLSLKTHAVDDDGVSYELAKPYYPYFPLSLVEEIMRELAS